MDPHISKRYASNTTIPRKALRPNGSRIALVFLFILALFHLNELYIFGDYLHQKSPFSNQKELEQPFVPTARELACLHGEALPNEPPLLLSESLKPIPNIVHFVFLQDPKTDTKEFGFLNYLAVRSAIISIQPKSLQLHYAFTSEPSPSDPRANPLKNPWINRLKDEITIVYHHSSEFASQTHGEHAADILRHHILRLQGGIYLDMDVFALRPFTKLLNTPHPHNIVMGFEGGNRARLCDAVVVARPNSTLLNHWISKYGDADFSTEWNSDNAVLPKTIDEENAEEICKLPPDSFFWPTWTWNHIEWMHQPLAPKEANFWQGEIDRTGGSLFDNQVAYHAWTKTGWERYLKHLTPARVRTRDTRFNLLVRRFLDDDL